MGILWCSTSATVSFLDILWVGYIPTMINIARDLSNGKKLLRVQRLSKLDKAYNNAEE